MKAECSSRRAPPLNQFKDAFRQDSLHFCRVRSSNICGERRRLEDHGITSKEVSHRRAMSEMDRKIKGSNDGQNQKTFSLEAACQPGKLRLSTAIYSFNGSSISSPTGARRLLKNPRTSRVSYLGQISVEGRGASPEGAVTEERRREVPQRAHALRVAPIFGPRYVATLVRSAAATPCAWLLAIFRKLTAT